MITERPLKEVPTRALYALHAGIEKTDGLIRGTYRDERGYTCALGSVGNQIIPIMKDNLFRYDLLNTLRSLDLIGNIKGIRPEVFINGGTCIQELNDGFTGAPQQRREFMLRHIVEELRQRSKPLPNKRDRAPKILTHEIG